MKTKAQSTYILLEKDTEDVELLKELSRLARETSDLQYPKIHELIKALESETGYSTKVYY